MNYFDLEDGWKNWVCLMLGGGKTKPLDWLLLVLLDDEKNEGLVGDDVTGLADDKGSSMVFSNLSRSFFFLCAIESILCSNTDFVFSYIFSFYLSFYFYLYFCFSFS